MTTYSIDDAHSNALRQYLPEATARRIALQLANDRGDSVWLYRDSEGAQAFEAEEIKPTHMLDAKLHWDDQDPRNAGWWLSYREADGTQQGISIEADYYASIEQLAAALTAEPHWFETGTVKVFRRGVPIGKIYAHEGSADMWRAL